MMATNDNVTQMQTRGYAIQINRQGIHIPIVIPKDTYQTMKMRQDDELWISVPDNYRETGQRQDFNDYGLVQDEYLQSLEKTDNLRDCICQTGQSSSKINKEDIVVKHKRTQRHI